jgi:hypothetical protein
MVGGRRIFDRLALIGVHIHARQSDSSARRFVRRKHDVEEVA